MVPLRNGIHAFAPIIVRIVFGKVIIQREAFRGRLILLEFTDKTRLFSKDYANAVQGTFALGILHRQKVVSNCLQYFVTRRKVYRRAMILGAL